MCYYYHDYITKEGRKERNVLSQNMAIFFVLAYQLRVSTAVLTHEGIFTIVMLFRKLYFVLFIFPPALETNREGQIYCS